MNNLEGVDLIVWLSKAQPEFITPDKAGKDVFFVRFSKRRLTPDGRHFELLPDQDHAVVDAEGKMNDFPFPKTDVSVERVAVVAKPANFIYPEQVFKVIRQVFLAKWKNSEVRICRLA